MRLGVARSLPFRKVSAARLVQQLRPLLSEVRYATAAQDLAARLAGLDGAAVAAGYLSEALESVQRPPGLAAGV